MADPDFWRDKRVLLTGHTGFKGSWLSLWLQSLGATVQGYALDPPTSPSLYRVARVGDGMSSVTGDVRDLEHVTRSMATFHPEVVLHMAAQPLVRASYADPVGTYATNVMGTVHLLEALRRLDDVRSVVVVTTDKCYENREWPWGYRETEAMGGRDPYSSSKGCAELVAAAYRSSLLSGHGVGVATARAGNVIGGGDWAADRLVPDVLEAFERGRPVRVRNPLATRPWQHVLEPLSGYLALAQAVWHDPAKFGDGWNFGPRDDDARPVQWIVERMARAWGDGARWELDDDSHPHEARDLKLDISKAGESLRWHPRWRLEETLDRIIAWHRLWVGGGDMRARCLEEIAEYQSAAD